jgi:hypothetical protein
MRRAEILDAQEGGKYGRGSLEVISLKSCGGARIASRRSARPVKR